MNRRDVLKLAAVSPLGIAAMKLPAPFTALADKVARFKSALQTAGIDDLYPQLSSDRRGLPVPGWAGLLSVEANPSRRSAEVRMYKMRLRPGSRGIEASYIKELAVDMDMCSPLDRVAFCVVMRLMDMDWSEIPMSRADVPLEPVVF
jgi:hypothetical protein